MARLAHDLTAISDKVRTVRRAFEQRRQRTRVQRHGRPLAFELRHEAGRICGGDGTVVATGQAALRRAIRLHTCPAGQEIWRLHRAAQRPDTGASPRQYVEPGMVEYISARCSAKRKHWIRPDENIAGA